MRSPGRALGVRIIVCAVTVAGCQAVFGIHGATLSDGGTGQPCNEDSNNGAVSRCGADLVCVMNQCRKPCSGDLECAAGERCLPTDSHNSCNPVCPGGCIPSASAQCNPQNPCSDTEKFIGASMVGGCGKGDSFNCTCKGGTVCAQDGQCRSSCSTGNMGGLMCAGGQSCLGDPTACRNTMGGNGQCNGACYGAPPHDTPIGGDGGGGGGATVFFDAVKGNALSIVAADNGVYFTLNGGGGLFGCPFDSCNSPAPMMAGSAPMLLAISGHTLAFTNQQSIELGVCMNAAPGMCSLSKLVSGGMPNGVAVQNNSVAWRDDSGMVYANNGMDKLGLASFSGPGAIALIEQYVYWTANGHVLACAQPLASCNNPLTVAASNAGASVTGSNATVFWTESSGIRAAPLGQTTSGTWVNTQSAPGSVVYDSYTGSIFWTEGDGSVKRATTDKTPASVTTLVSGGMNPGSGIAVTNTHVYWIAGGKIYRAPKG